MSYILLLSFRVSLFGSVFVKERLVPTRVGLDEGP